PPCRENFTLHALLLNIGLGLIPKIELSAECCRCSFEFCLFRHGERAHRGCGKLLQNRHFANYATGEAFPRLSMRLSIRKPQVCAISRATPAHSPERRRIAASKVFLLNASLLQGITTLGFDPLLFGVSRFLLSCRLFLKLVARHLACGTRRLCSSSGHIRQARPIPAIKAI